MKTTNEYLPHPVFCADENRVPRAMLAPQRYIQGDGVLDHMGGYLTLLNARRPGILVSTRGQRADGARVIASLGGAGIDPVISTFNGECSLDEITLHARQLESKSVDCLIAIGGGKCVDAGKCIAYRLGIPVVIVPTLASNDAPCSALSVLYTPEGVSSSVEFFPDNPALVVVDTGVVANASERYLVAGIGDAMATWYEARVCLQNPNAITTTGTRPTLAAAAIAEICAKTLFNEGLSAAKAVAENQVTDALENVVEANTLLSGLGFESGGLAVAHGIAQSYTAVPVVHNNYLHGEMVAMGTLTQLVMESKEEARRVAQFFAEVGLPIHLGQLSLSTDDKDALAIVAEATMEFPFIGNMPLALTSESVLMSIVEAHELGLAVAHSVGDAVYRRLHRPE